MDCQDYRIFITAYLDGELSEDEMCVLQAHISTCKACVAYLKRAEAMQTVLKRSHLLQPAPDVPADFAQRVAREIRTTLQQERPPLAVRLARTYRDFVLGWAEKWRQSLRARPYAWITSAACLCVALAGLTFFNLFRNIYESPHFPPAPQVASRSEQATLPAEPFETVALKRNAAQPIVLSEEETAISKGSAEEPRAIVVTRAAPQAAPAQFQALTQDTIARVASDQDRAIEGAPDQTSEFPALIQVSDDPLIQVAHNGNTLMENYIYSHVLEASDNTVFVGYVQNTIFR